MHWECFYVNPKRVRAGDLVFEQDEAHHLFRVLRKKKGDVVWAVDGEGGAYEVKLVSVSGTRAIGKIIKTRRRFREPVAEVTLAQGVLKGDRFDWLVEKTTEIGIRKIIPMLTETSETVAGPQKLARWKRVALAALKQSGRSILPEITPAKNLKQVLALGATCHYRFIAHSGPGSSPMRIARENHPLTTSRAFIIVGPEGGFTEKEIQQARDNGFKVITLGPRRLRAETSGILLTALVLSQMGELE